MSLGLEPPKVANPITTVVQVGKGPLYIEPYWQYWLAAVYNALSRLAIDGGTP